MPTKHQADPLVSTLNHLLTKKLDPIVDKLERMDFRIREIQSNQQILDRRFNDLDLKVDNMGLNLNKKVDNMNTTLNKKVDNMNTTLNKKVDNMNTTLNNKVDKIHKKQLEIIDYLDGDHEKTKKRVKNIEYHLNIPTPID